MKISQLQSILNEYMEIKAKDQVVFRLSEGKLVNVDCTMAPDEHIFQK